MSDDVWVRWGGRVPHFVGRDEEWRALDAALERSMRFAAPQFVTVVGASGAGKTRLVDEWLDDVVGRDTFRVVRAGASGDATPFALVADLLRNRFGIDAGLEESAAQTMFRAQLQVVFGDRRVADIAGLLGRFLGLRSPDSPLGQTLALNAEREADLSRAVLGRFLEDDALLRPLIVVLEDLHAADDASLDLLASLARELGEAALLFVVTARPELFVRRPDWGRGEGCHSRVELGPLSSPELAALLGSALGTSLLAPGLPERAMIECGGNPHLLAKLLAAYEARGVLVAESLDPSGARWAFDAARAARAQHIALSPEAAAHARIVELSPAERDLLARGAAFGTTFWTGGAIALGRLGATPSDPTSVFAPDRAIEEVRRLLVDLEARGYLERYPSPTLPGETEWTFVAPLEREMAVAQIEPDLMRRRRLFAAQWLEGRTPIGELSDRFELLGELYDGGGDPRRAGECFVAAGDRAVTEQRQERARSLYLRGVQLLDLGDSVFKMDALHKLGDVATRIGRTREALHHFGEMLRIAWRLDLPAKGGAAHARIGRLHRTLGDLRLARKHLELARLLFELAGDVRGMAGTLDDLGRVQLLGGRPDEALRLHRSALPLREELGEPRGRALTLSWMGLAALTAGELRSARARFREALTLYQESGDELGVAHCLSDVAALEREMGRPERALPLVEQAIELAERLGEPLAGSHFSLRMAECALASGDVRTAARVLAAAKPVAQKFGARRLLAEMERALGACELAGGRAAAAAVHAEAALELAERMGAPAIVGAALVVLAQAYAAGVPGDSDRGGPRELFDRSIEVLGSTGAELELARALLAYADFEEQGGRVAAASSLRAQAAQIRADASSGEGEGQAAEATVAAG